MDIASLAGILLALFMLVFGIISSAGVGGFREYLDPASAIIFAAIFLRERMSLLQVVGAALIIGGAAFGELYKKRKS